MRRLTLSAFLALLSIFFAIPTASANDCDPCNILKSPTCAERIKRATAAGCDLKSPPEVVTVTKEVPGPERIVTKEVRVEVPGPERIVTHTVEVEVTPPAKGHFLLGAGPVRFHAANDEVNWGGAVVAGWQFASGWQIQAGPLWMPQDDFHGTVTKGCTTLPYTVESPNPWAVQALALYRF